MSGFILDNSVWQRLSHHPSVLRAYDELVAAFRPSSFTLCAPQVAEIAFSARNAHAMAELIRNLSQFRRCAHHALVDDVLNLQRLLWSTGLVRACGATDVVIAAYALANDATVLHYDSDFEHIAAVEPRFKHRWVVPRGSL